MYTGEQLRPSHNSVVRHGDRYFNIMERVVDSNPDWASSMKAAEEELKNPVKNFDKLKTLYDKVKKAEDDETRETMIHSSLLPSKSPRSFTYRRNSNPYSHIPNEFMYRKPYDGDDDGDAYRTPAKTRGDDGDDSDDGDDFDMLLQSRKKKNQHHDYLTAHHRRCVHLPLLYPTRTRTGLVTVLIFHTRTATIFRIIIIFMYL